MKGHSTVLARLSKSTAVPLRYILPSSALRRALFGRSTIPNSTPGLCTIPAQGEKALHSYPRRASSPENDRLVGTRVPSNSTPRKLTGLLYSGFLIRFPGRAR